MVKNILKLAILLLGYQMIQAQEKYDTINNWRAKFVSLGRIPSISKEGNWIGINKINKQDGDSTFVISTKDHAKTIFRIMNSDLTFLNEKGVLGKKKQKVIFLNLNTGNTYHFDNVIKTYTLDKTNRYALLFKDRHLRIYNNSGKMLLEISNVDDLPVHDSKGTLYLKRQKDEKWEVLATTGEKEAVVYSTGNRIRKMEVNILGEQLLITETLEKKSNDRLIILDSKNSNKNFLELDIPKEAIINLSKIQEGKAFLISARVGFKEVTNSLVEIWYGNDPYVNEHYRMFSHREFWIWHPKNDKLQKIAVPESYEVNSLNNDRYFLTYLPRKDHNYITSEPELNGAQVLDLKNYTYCNLGDLKVINQQTRRSSRMKGLSSEIFCSPDGKMFLASTDGIKWNLYNSNGIRQGLIDKTGLSQPVYSSNGENIYFESNDGLWSYNIKQSQLAHLNVGKGKISKIKNYVLNWNDQYRSAITFLRTEEILAEIYDKDENIVSFSLFSQKKWKQIVPPTKNRINNNCLIFNPAMTSFFTLEENYNLPPTLYKYNNVGQKHLFFDGNIRDKEAKEIKQEIYSYSAVGKNLKGILYYPTNFRPENIYPLVVNIYELQRETSNEYLSPNNLMPVGFQIRTLLERGYFVYLPDIAYGPKGTGISAMECVNTALDVILKNPNIDPTKIGLIGHSHGGYETNFIATHSNRFAAYISGAGNSDIIRSYYSYNYDFVKPFYFQYESGQYDMGIPVAMDKNHYLENSPILNVDKVNAPILLWAGKKDENIQWGQVMEFYIGLRRYKKNVVALFYPKGGHDLVFQPIEAEDRNKRILQWWDYFLKGKKDIPWISKQIENHVQ